jgi:DNA polymerase
VAPAPSTAASRKAEQAPAAVPPATAPAADSKPAVKALPPVGLPAADPRPLAEMTAELTRLAAEAAECRQCGLCETRTRVVYGTGTARQPLMFIGEAPGFNEDQEGVPFVGRAGKLLTDIITAMGFDRAQIYIANVLKCRPPENRDPLPHETAACYPWLERQIELVKPRVICTVGSHSARLLTGRPKDTIGTLRGKVHYYKGIPVVPTYHPAFLLRSPGYKRFTWEDVQLVRDLYLKNDAPRQSEVGGLPSGEPT